MSNSRRELWDYFTGMNVTAFMNHLAFLKDKAQHEKDEMDRIMKRNRIH